jgi:predicted RNA-binding protein Jag
MFKNCLEEAIEHALQEINVTADDATEHMNQQAKQLIQEMTSH